MCIRLARYLYGGYQDYMRMPLCELEVLMEAAQKAAAEEAEKAGEQKAGESGDGKRGAKVESELRRIAQKQAAEQSNG